MPTTLPSNDPSTAPTSFHTSTMIMTTGALTETSETEPAIKTSEIETSISSSSSEDGSSNSTGDGNLSESTLLIIVIVSIIAFVVLIIALAMVIYVYKKHTFKENMKLQQVQIELELHQQQKRSINGTTSTNKPNGNTNSTLNLQLPAMTMAAIPSGSTSRGDRDQLQIVQSQSPHDGSAMNYNYNQDSYDQYVEGLFDTNVQLKGVNSVNLIDNIAEGADIDGDLTTGGNNDINIDAPLKYKNDKTTKNGGSGSNDVVSVVIDEAKYQSWTQKDVLAWIKYCLLHNGFENKVIKPFLIEFSQKYINGKMLKQIKQDMSLLKQLQSQFTMKNQAFGIWMVIKAHIETIGQDLEHGSLDNGKGTAGNTVDVTVFQD